MRDENKFSISQKQDQGNVTLVFHHDRSKKRGNAALVFHDYDCLSMTLVSGAP